jgi:predicted PurR-regulated permease PerM
MAEPKKTAKKAPEYMLSRFEDRVLLGFVIAASLGMFWISWPFFGAILWGLIAAIMFAPVNDWLALKMPKYRNLAAIITLLLVVAVVIIPAFTVGSLMVDQALETYDRLQSRQLDFGKIFADLRSGIPPAMMDTLERFGFGDFKSIQDKLSSVVTTGLRLVAGQAVNIGQGAFGFAMSMGIMLYLTFFLLRDGRQLTRKIGDAVPLHAQDKSALFDKFITVIRATVKGSIVVAVVQGMLGGLIFWFLGIEAALLWGVVMAVLSLVPAVGTGLVWVPVAIYLFATGAVRDGIILTLFGIIVIGMVDNVLRPILVGADTRMPDYVVLVATLGGISVFGINGFIIGPMIAAMFIAAWEIFAQTRIEKHAGLERD